MKLQELAQAKATRQVAQVFESYFGSRVTFERLNPLQTQTMLKRVRGLIKEHRATVNRHTSERDPAYLKLIMMEQALVGRLNEFAPPATTPQGKPAQPGQATPAAAPAAAPVDPKKLADVQKKLAQGQAINAAEQEIVNAAAAVQQKQMESRLRRAFRTLKESEVQQAQVVLAAQDMVDSMQGMIEDATEMQYKELPALVDSIRNQIGMDQANQFNTDATAALTGLVQSLQGAKQSLETALGVVTGQAQPAPALDAAMNAPAPDMAAPAPDMAAAGGELPPPPEVGAEEEPAAAAPGSLGRERR